MGHYYDRLTAVAQLPGLTGLTSSATDNVDITQGAEAIRQLGECRKDIQRFRDDCGLTGQTRDAVLAWLDRQSKALDDLEPVIKAATDAGSKARGVMGDAAAAYRNMSSQLTSPAEESQLRKQGSHVIAARHGVDVSVVGTLAPEELLKWMASERDHIRETESKKILDKMNDAIENISLNTGKIDDNDEKDPKSPAPSSSGSSSSGGPSVPSSSPPPLPNMPSLGDTVIDPWKKPVPPVPPPPVVPPDTNSLNTGASSAAAAHSSYSFDTGSTSATTASGQGAIYSSGSSSGGGGVPDDPSSAWSGAGGSAGGSNYGGYQPAPILDGNDPRWGSSYVIPTPTGLGTPASSVAVVGGVLTVGGAAAVAAHMGMSGATALAYNAATGAGSVASLPTSGLSVNTPVPAGGMLTPGGGTASGGYGAAGGGYGAGGGSAGTGGAARSGAAGAAATNGQRSGAMGATSDRDDKKKKDKRRLLGYVAPRLEDDQVLPAADLTGPGCAADLRPVHNPDTDDTW